MAERTWGRAAVGAVSLLVGALFAGQLPGTSLPTAVAQTSDAARTPSKAADESARDTLSPDIDRAREQARRGGKQVEVVSERGASREVFANPSGSLTEITHMDPVRTRRAGKWVDIDTGLRRVDDVGIVPVASAADVVFSAGGSRDPLVRMVKAGRELSLSWPGTLPAPAISGSSATYAEVLPDVDLRMTAEPDGFSQVLVVKSAEAAANPALTELRLPMAGKGLTVRSTVAGGLEAVDTQAGGVAFEAAQPVMWDSREAGTGAAASTGASTRPKASVARSAASDATKSAAPQATSRTAPASQLYEGPGDASARADVHASVTGNSLLLTPDPKLLSGEETRYPVFIDPAWSSPRSSAYAMVSRAYPDSDFYKFDGAADSGLGFCPPNFTGLKCAPNDAKRLFYKLPVTSFVGKSITSAEFVVRETFAYNCVKQPVEFWRTKALTSTTSWNDQKAAGYWIDQMPTVTAAKGATASCPDGDLEFNAKDAVVWAAADKQTSLTFGLKAPNESAENQWKRFAGNGFLRVEYNNPPNQPKQSQLTMNPGGTCTLAPKAVNVIPKATAVLSDPDKDQVYAEFKVEWDSGDGWKEHWNSGRIGPKASGQPYTITLPSTIPQNVKASWSVRASDGKLWGPWSYAGDTQTGCYLIYDSKHPTAPTVVSSQYPASRTDDPLDPWLDGVGRYGRFTIDSTAPDVTKYWFGLNADPTAANERKPATPGAAVAIDVMPTRPGLNNLYVQAWDANNNDSTIASYQFRVATGQPERAAWTLDAPAGSTQDPGSGGARPAQLDGTAVLGEPGVSGTALALNSGGAGDGYAAAGPHLLDTDGDFTVSTWVRLDSDAATATAVSVDGTSQAGFYLGYEQGSGRWALRVPTKDAAGADFDVQRVVSPAPPEVGKWTHLVAVRDAVAGKYTLYVDGVAAGTSTVTTPWHAAANLQFGRAKYNGAYGEPWQGAIDETAVYDRPLGAQDVGRLARKEPVPTGRPAKAAWDFDDAATSPVAKGASQVNPLVLKGGGGTFGVPGNVAGALDLSSTDNGYASTTGPQLNTLRSFSVSAWARLPKVESNSAQIIATQAGAQQSGFELYYSGSYRRWVFNRYNSDTAGVDPTRGMANLGKPAADQVYPGESWHHLLGVYDGTLKELRLYVDGGLVSTVPFTPAPWDATGPVQVGAGSYGGRPDSFFKGQIDDVRLYDRVVSKDEAGDLFKQHPQVKGRWKFDTTTPGTPASSPDDSAGKRPAVLGAQAAVQPGAGWVGGDGGLVLDGVDDYAAAATVPVNTKESFTVTAWVDTAARPQKKVTVLSAEGAVNSAFTVRYAPDATDPQNQGGYELELPSADTAGAARPVVRHSSFHSVFEWDHLAVVYDAFADEARLYVNGQLEQVLDAMSWRANVQPFQATKQLQFGRNKENGTPGEYWPGVIDDVWMFSGVASDAQIVKLGNGESLDTVPGP
ncbi:LamG-like jellyroll fold domain-containing protein [Streptomyces mirabilis]|uniref:LamG-like jellyroll fold domain-containing protein n=1 Tax=Streptomyces mirabilis TaxID=68239 RepID=UPI0036DF1206